LSGVDDRVDACDLTAGDIQRHHAVPQWTRTRNWTTALLAFKIHFGDRIPDTATCCH
jgi:hypothetical protein